jgi:hypothetical protein
VHGSRDEGQGGGHAERRGRPAGGRRDRDRRDGEVAREKQQADRQLGEPGYGIGRERDAACARPVDYDAAEGQQGDTRQHPADQDDGQPGRRAGRGHDCESERGRADGVTERINDPPGEQNPEVPFPQGMSHAAMLICIAGLDE